jgi:hypothetical protein
MHENFDLRRSGLPSATEETTQEVLNIRRSTTVETVRRSRVRSLHCGGDPALDAVGAVDRAADAQR